MKKFLPGFLLFLCIFLFGCQQAKDSQKTTKETPPSSSTENTVAEKPLPLTAENLAGRWYDNYEVIEFTADYKYIGAKGTTDGSYKIIKDIKLYKEQNMKKLFSVLFGISLMFVFFACELDSETEITELSFLTEESVKGFIENHENLLNEIQKSEVKGWIEHDPTQSVKELFNALRKKAPPATLQTIFRKNDLDERTGHLQIATILKKKD